MSQSAGSRSVDRRENVMKRVVRRVAALPWCRVVLFGQEVAPERPRDAAARALVAIVKAQRHV